MDMTALRSELASPEHDEATRERITISAMKNVLTAHSKAGTWRGDAVDAVAVLHQAGFTMDEAIAHHLDAIDLIAWDGLMLELAASTVVVLIGVGVWCGWWIALPGGV